MQSIIIQPKDQKEFLFISEMLKKMDIKSKVLTDEEKEDFALGKAIEIGMKTKNVPKSAILKLLKK